MTEYKTNILKSVVLLCTNKNHAEKEITKITSFTMSKQTNNNSNKTTNHIKLINKKKPETNLTKEINQTLR